MHQFVAWNLVCFECFLLGGNTFLSPVPSYQSRIKSEYTVLVSFKAIRIHTAISIKVVPEQSGKVEYERERLAGNRKKLINFLAIPSSLSRSYSTFPLCSGTTLINSKSCI